MEKIDFEHYRRPYFSPDKGEEYRLVLANWHEEQKSFDDDKTLKWVMIMDILKLNGTEYPLGKLTFSSGAASFAESIQPIFEKAEAAGRLAVEVALIYSKEKRYTVIDMGLVQQVIKDAEPIGKAREEARMASIKQG